MLKELLDNPRQIFRLFAAGTVAFFLGAGIYLLAGRGMTPSIEQDVAHLLGLLVAGAGFTVAMLAQLLLIVERLRR